MAMPFDPEEIDDLDVTLLEDMEADDLADFREQLEETLDEMLGLEPDEEEDEEAYYEWEDRINVLHEMIDAIDEKLP